MQIIKSFMALIYALMMTFGLTTAGDIEVTDVPSKAESDIRIVSFNLRTADDIYGSVKNRSKFIGATIKAYHPDSFGVQECNKNWLNYLENELGDEYAHVGLPRDNSANTEYSCVYYLKDKYNLLDSGTMWLSETPDVAGSKSFSSSYPRICTWAVLENKESGEVYTHLNTHLDHLLEKARVGQAGVLLEKAKELSEVSPVVITGDFNGDESSKMYGVMTSQYKDSKYLATISDSGKTFHNYGRGDALHNSPIDFIFVPEGTDVSTYKIIDNMVQGMYLSDHYGLCVDLTF